MHAAVVVAHDAGKPVAAHALATQGIINAIRAGVDTVEHGVFLDEQGIELMLEHNVTLCPTISVYPRIVERGQKGGEPQFVIDKSVPLIEPHLANFARAVKAGVRIVFGTDSATLYNPIGDFAAEMALMVKAGMSPVAVLQAATGTAADICGIGHLVGTLGAGKEADVVVVEGDATRDIAALNTPRAVYRAGMLVHEKGNGFRHTGLSARPILTSDIEW
jgi:imidazolonepropionase-like amidohydrolase